MSPGTRLRSNSTALSRSDELRDSQYVRFSSTSEKSRRSAFFSQPSQSWVILSFSPRILDGSNFVQFPHSTRQSSGLILLRFLPTLANRRLALLEPAYPSRATSIAAVTRQQITGGPARHQTHSRVLAACGGWRVWGREAVTRRPADAYKTWRRQKTRRLVPKGLDIDLRGC